MPICPDQPDDEEPGLDPAGECPVSPAGAADLLPLVYQELRALAGSFLAASGQAHTLQPTALVHEAYIRMARAGDAQWSDRTHFLNVAALAMRQLLADYARAKRTDKRGGGRSRVRLEDSDQPMNAHEIDIVALDDSLRRLAELNPRHARVVELRFLAGLGVDQTARVMGISPRTVESEWRFARAWLRQNLAEADGR